MRDVYGDKLFCRLADYGGIKEISLRFFEEMWLNFRNNSILLVFCIACCGV